MRNRFVHDGDNGLGEDVIEGVEHFLEAYRGPSFPEAHRDLVQRNLERTPRIKINFDVGFFELDRFQVNEDGACVWWRARRFLGQPSSVVKEARAAIDKGWTVIVLEGDNSQIIAAIQKREASSLLPYGAFISA